MFMFCNALFYYTLLYIIVRHSYILNKIWRQWSGVMQSFSVMHVYASLLFETNLVVQHLGMCARALAPDIMTVTWK